MSKLGFLEFAAKELVRPGMKPFTIGLAANFVMFACIPTSGALIHRVLAHCLCGVFLPFVFPPLQGLPSFPPS